MALHIYRGCGTYIRYSKPDNVYWGKIENVTDLVTFEGKTYEEAKQEFKDAVDAYIHTANKIGKLLNLKEDQKTLEDIKEALEVDDGTEIDFDGSIFDDWLYF